MNDHSHFLSKGALLLKGLGFGEQNEYQLSAFVFDTFLHPFQTIAKLLIEEKIPVSIGVATCHFLLEKGITDPKNKYEFDREPLQALVNKGARDFEVIMASPVVSNKTKILINAVLAQAHLPQYEIRGKIKE